MLSTCMYSISCGFSHSGPHYKCPALNEAVVVPPNADFGVSYNAEDKIELCNAYKMEAFLGTARNQLCKNGLKYWAGSVREYIRVSGSHTGVFCYQKNTCK